MPFSHNFLENDGHLLFARIVACGLDVITCFLEIGGSVNKLDSLCQSPETGVLIELIVRDHFRAVDAGEWPVERILQQTGRADGQRCLDLRDQRPQVAQ